MTSDLQTLEALIDRLQNEADADIKQWETALAAFEKIPAEERTSEHRAVFEAAYLGWLKRYREVGDKARMGFAALCRADQQRPKKTN